MRYLTLILVIAFVSCKSIKISNANKTLVKKGNKLGTDFIEYAVFLEADKEFSVNNLTIEGSSDKIDFYYKDLKTGLSSHKMLNPFPKGNYSFNFKLENFKNFSNEEFLILDYTLGGKKQTKKIAITENKKTFYRR
jgi:hypothetical protein